MSYDYKSIEVAALGTLSERNIVGTRNGGKKRVRIAEYEAAAVASTKTIHMMTLPKGCYILNMRVFADALGSGVTLAVGDGTTADKYLSATAFNTAAKEQACTPGLPVALTADTDIVLTVGGAAATGTIVLVTEYIESVD